MCDMDDDTDDDRGSDDSSGGSCSGSGSSDQGSSGNTPNGSSGAGNSSSSDCIELEFGRGNYETLSYIDFGFYGFVTIPNIGGTKPDTIGFSIIKGESGTYDIGSASSSPFLGVPNVRLHVDCDEELASRDCKRHFAARSGAMSVHSDIASFDNVRLYEYRDNDDTQTFLSNSECYGLGLGN